MTTFAASQAPLGSRLEMAPPTPRRDAFRSAMRQLPSGVSIVTSGEGSAKTGHTATSVSFLSADPPTLVVCVSRAASIDLGLAVGERFGLSILAAGQSEIAERFDGHAGLKGDDLFGEGRWLTTPGRVCVLPDAAAIFECEVEDVIDRHTHAIIIGHVLFSATGAPGGALVRWRGGYDQIGWSAEQVSRAIGLKPTG